MAGSNGQDANVRQLDTTSASSSKSGSEIVIWPPKKDPCPPASFAGPMKTRRVTSLRTNARETLRCHCAECASLDQLPERLQGWPGCYQLMLFQPRTYDRVWRWRVNLPERKGMRLRVIARGTMNSALIEFEDGVRHVVSRFAFRRAS